jgi:hypothetical protein
MKEKWWVLILLAFVVGIAVGIVYQKRHIPPIHIRVGDVSQQALLNPWPRDVIEWVDHEGHPMTPPLPDFDFVSPCDPKHKDACHVLDRANGLTYSYKCPKGWKCDPEVPVGSDVVGQVRSMRADAALAPAQAHIGCDSANQNMAAVSPNPAMVSISAQGAIYWKGVDTATMWTLAMPAGICTESTIDQTNNLCTLANGVVPKMYEYTVTVTAKNVPAACKSAVTAHLDVK